MARKARDSNIAFNFDGLTDSVTNLVGALILLVVLLLGATTSAVRDVPPTPSSEGRQAGSASLTALLRSLSVLQAQIDGTESQLRLLERDVNAMREQADSLINARTRADRD
jgi:TolA-binding protein